MYNIQRNSMKKAIISPLLLLLFSYSTLAQKREKADTTVVLQNDNYANFRHSGTAPSPDITIPYESAGNNGKPVLIAFDYKKITALADSNFNKKQYNAAIGLYTTAFKKNNDLGLVKHRYNLACCYAMTSNADSAFIQLFRIAEKGKYFNYAEIEADLCFKALHTSNKWKSLMAIIQKNAQQLIDKADAANEKNDQ